MPKQMDDDRNSQDKEAERLAEDRRQEAVQQYKQAQSGPSIERERAALQSLDMQTLRNQIERLERRVARLEEERGRGNADATRSG